MNRVAAIAILASLLSACTLWPPKQNPGWGEATGVEQFERLVWQEIKNKDWDELDRRLASNFTHSTKDRTLNKQETLDVWRSFELNDYLLGDFNIAANGDTVTATYTATFNATMNGGQKIQRTGLRRMTVWQQQKSGWVLLALADLN